LLDTGEELVNDRERADCSEPDRSEIQVSPLPQELPVSELITESKPAIFREAEDVELLVVHELGGAPLPDVRFHVAQVFRREDEVPNSVVGGFVLVRFHGHPWERSVVAACIHLPGGHFSAARWPYCRMGNLPDEWKSYKSRAQDKRHGDCGEEEARLVNFARYVRERRKSIREAVGHRARAEAQKRGQRPAYAPPNRAARRRYWK